jgi:hypothetical protein
MSDNMDQSDRIREAWQALLDAKLAMVIARAELARYFGDEEKLDEAMTLFNIVYEEEEVEVEEEAKAA